MGFFGSELGIGIAWVSTVVSGVAAVIALLDNSRLRKQVVALKNINVELNKSIESNSNNGTVSNSGKLSIAGNGNVLTAKNSGGINIKM